MNHCIEKRKKKRRRNKIYRSYLFFPAFRAGVKEEYQPYSCTVSISLCLLWVFRCHIMLQWLLLCNVLCCTMGHTGKCRELNESLMAKHNDSQLGPGRHNGMLWAKPKTKIKGRGEWANWGAQGLLYLRIKTLQWVSAVSKWWEETSHSVILVGSRLMAGMLRLSLARIQGTKTGRHCSAKTTLAPDTISWPLFSGSHPWQSLFSLKSG